MSTEAGESGCDLASGILAALLVEVNPFVGCKLLERVTLVHPFHVLAIHRFVVLANQIVGHRLGLHSSEKSDEEHEADSENDPDEVSVADAFVEVTVLPDDICWLRGLSHLAS